ncbi:MAG: hydrolase 1, exosortase A system-associated, partial [Qipengyuania sp.]
AQLAADIARAGFPVFRFDRRGIGDSDGENRGFRKSQADIAAALDAFRALAPGVTRVVGFGNCDAATALMLASGAGCDALVLSNPWTIDEDADAMPPPATIRARYIARLKDPHEVLRLLGGKVDFRKLLRGIAWASAPRRKPGSLALEAREGLSKFDGPVRILIAESDRTAQVFLENWEAGDSRLQRCADAGHSYAEPHARKWLRDQILAALRR